MNQLNHTTINPTYVQITKKAAANLLGISTAELDKRRRTDPRCPKGFKESDSQTSPIRFRLSDIYNYSEAIMNSAFQATG